MGAMIRYVSLFSGIEGFGLGLQAAGWEGAGHSEVDPDCVRVLERWFPGTRQLGDVRALHARAHCPAGGCAGCLPDVDALVGGFPCQDISIAGRRAGLAGERSGLWAEFHRLIAELHPRWVVIENVPGLLSSCGCPACAAHRKQSERDAADGDGTRPPEPDEDEEETARLVRPEHRGRDLATLDRK